MSESPARQISIEARRLLRAALTSPSTDFPVPFTEVRSTPKVISGAENLPLLSVMILSEVREAEGDYSAGEPHFTCRLTLGILAQVAASEEVSQELQLERVSGAIDTYLLRNPDFINMTEGVISSTRRNVYAVAGDAGHAQVQYELVLGYRTRLEPIIPDELDVINVRTRYPSKDTNPDVIEQPWGVDGQDFPQND